MTTWRGVALSGWVMLVGAFRVVGAQEAPGVVVDVGWLATHLDDPRLVVLQVGPDEQYSREHIQRARPVSTRDVYRRPRTDLPPDQQILVELPDWDDLRNTLEGLGISHDSRVVVVPAGNWLSPATRVMFTLDAAGLGGRSHFLDGGLEAWKAAGHPVTDELPNVERGSLSGPPAERVVDTDWVRAGNAARDGFALMDTRPRAYYDGVERDQATGELAGHIHGARSLFWGELWNEPGPDGAAFLKSPGELRERFAAAGVADGDVVVAYCHVGRYATAVLLAARLLGHQVLLYDGSMNEWALRGLPVETGSGR